MRPPNKLKWVWLILAMMLFACDQGTKQPAIVTNQDDQEQFKKLHLDKITLPAGFKISVYALVPNARSLCWGAKGTLFVGNRDEDKVYAVRDTNNDGRADDITVIARNLNQPNGVAFRNGSL
jgi:hypothetical protein